MFPGPEPLFCNACGVLLLNLQPEAKSEEFVVGEVAPGQLLRRFRASGCGLQCYSVDSICCDSE